MTEITILSLLNERPMYGAEMVEEIKKLSGNTVIMSLPTLYSCLHRMAGKKWVNSYQRQSNIGGRCRVYNITKFGREYLNKNPIKIDYKLITDNSNLANKTFSTLEDAFSLPLSKSLTPATNTLIEEKRILNVTPLPEPAHREQVTQENLLTKEEPVALEPLKLTKTEPTIPAETGTKKTPQILPYVAPTEKITTTPEPQYQQTSIGLSGTVGCNDLRPLLKLNALAVGNGYVIINRLRIIATLLNTALFMLINFFCSLTHSVQSEYYTLIYITLGVYFFIQLSIYLVYPRIKAVFNVKKSTTRRCIIMLMLFALGLTYCIINGTTSLLWILFFALYPLIELILLLVLRGRSWFLC